MSVTQSRVKDGVLTLGGVDFSCQATSVRVTPDRQTSGEAAEVLCGTVVPADSKRVDTLNITSIQDFDDPAGFHAYTWAHDGEEVLFSWWPNPHAPTYSGKVTVAALESGGDVNTRLTAQAQWPISGAARCDYPV